MLLGALAEVSPETEVRLHELALADPWDFEEVYGALFDFARSYRFRPGREDYLVHMTTGTHETFTHHTVLRDVSMQREAHDVLEAGLVDLRRELRKSAYGIINHWIERTTRHIMELRDQGQLDQLSQVLANFYGHLLLIFRNVKPREIDDDVASVLVSGFLFINKRQAFATTDLCSVDVFECLQACRHRLIEWSRTSGARNLSLVCEAAVRVVSSSGQRRLHTHLATNNTKGTSSKSNSKDNNDTANAANNNSKSATTQGDTQFPVPR